jgi:hypothetical protein
MLDFTTTMERPACINEKVLNIQAHTVYELAIKAYDDGNIDNYRLLMGVSNMLYQISGGKFKLTVVEGYDNCGEY